MIDSTLNFTPIKAQEKEKESEAAGDSKMSFTVSIEGINISEKETRKYIKNAIKFWIQHYKEDHPDFENVGWDEAKIKVKIVKEES